VVTLGGFLIYVNRLRAEHLDQLKTAKQNESQAQGALRTKVNEADTLRTLMGFDPDEGFDGIQTQFDDDMQKFGATFSEEGRAYRTVLSSVYEEGRRSTSQENEAKELVKQLNEKILALEAAKETQIKKFQETLTKVEADAAAERVKFNAARADLETKRADLAAALDRQRAEEKKRSDVFRRQIAVQENEIARLKENLRITIAKLPVSGPTSEIADGSVLSVSQREGTAWINLGSADTLRRQVTFSVYEQDAIDAGKAEKKGSIEVVRVLGDHTAEVQITSDDPRNPILPGDWIYSQVWHRGRDLRFALTGVIDFDGDGRNDIQRAKDLIALNGAVVDAVLEEDGSVTGELTAKTRYLVMGDFPNSSKQAGLRKGWETMSNDAETFGVDKITLQQFLDQMGYRPTDRTVVLGPGAKSSDFAPKRSDFRARTPYGSR
ncbi:MAG: hypothetical protein AAF368_07255, partial [Planctomycetota bacterium]